MEATKILTSNATVRVDWDNCEGSLVIENASTVDRYWEIDGMHPDTHGLGVFFAFSNEQFDRGVESLKQRGFIKDGEKVFRMDGGCFGCRSGLEAMIRFYENKRKMIASECVPQEVYWTECNNHEVSINFDGDLEPVRIVAGIWGWDVAGTIRRTRAMYTIDEIREMEKRR